ncbi:hypothetical protein H6P81_012396 [Aristolochia fimbriata]|uniref:Uncharacterized protein n=1 Tax=Aristolochia fimbriata TaxID=158543 RepID=A0AAV7EGB5_ARIFI|nr:hypothetical protein H6P81_012396 [Aristolochia fimbriata]
MAMNIAQMVFLGVGDGTWYCPGGNKCVREKAQYHMKSFNHSRPFVEEEGRALTLSRRGKIRELEGEPEEECQYRPPFEETERRPSRAPRETEKKKTEGGLDFGWTRDGFDAAFVSE